MFSAIFVCMLIGGLGIVAVYSSALQVIDNWISPPQEEEQAWFDPIKKV